jgi:seryl-tRNA synthetase
MVSLRTAGEFRADLLDAGVLVETGVDGLYHRSGAFERVVRGIERLASAAGADQNAPLFYFPPIMPRADFELTDYLRSFPNLIGSIDIFVGDDRDHVNLLRIAAEDGDWTQVLSPADVVLGSAACHSLYRGLAGRRSSGGERVECQGFIFRHEPSLDPARMQAFRMHEFVYIGEPEGAVAHRDLWLERGLELMGGLGLEVEAVVANDPFFGRAGRILATNQRETTLKYEITAPITSDQPTAICSANYHQDHFGVPFGIQTAQGAVAHSSCFGFGLERITLALLSRYGLDVDSWPDSVGAQLWR